jgi:trehalose/maltose transport system substrate-binding protein
MRTLPSSAALHQNRKCKHQGRTSIAIESRFLTIGLIFVLILFTEPGCRSASSDAGITLTLIEQAWLGSDPTLAAELAEYTRETGIRVQVMPAPEAAVEQLATLRKLLESGAEAPDIYAIDVIWPQILGDNLIDLKPYVPAEEIAAHFPELIADYTVNGRLVAVPYVISVGLLFYRTDLLHEYGYRTPPETWEELESMARRIQAGERAKGNKDFWGFVWQGAPSEALTCNALEWQVSEGGGTILDEHGRVTVNNPQTIRAWNRAARWVGSISPPGVTAYKEWDAFNIWQAGQAAFMRQWPQPSPFTVGYLVRHDENSPTRNQFDAAPLPRGSAGIATTLGGFAYGVSRHSRHPREAAMLVRFLTSPEEQARRSRKPTEPTTIPALYENPEAVAANPYFSPMLLMQKGIALRPSTPAGKMYPEVSRAYYEAVHAVLTQQQSAANAASQLQVQLVKLLASSAADANPSRR